MLLLSGEVAAYDRIWFIGDSFLNTSFQQYFMDVHLPNGKMGYILAHYDYLECYSLLEDIDLEMNVLAKLRNQLVAAINTEVLLPKAIIIVLDDDIMDALNYYDSGITQAIGRIIEWLAGEFHKSVNNHKQSLQSKSHKYKYPAILWMKIPSHTVYDHYNEFKWKFNKCLEKTSDLYREMSTLSLSTWDPRDLQYFSNGSINGHGLATYWQSVDDAFQTWDRLQMKEPLILQHADSNQQRTDRQQGDNYNMDDYNTVQGKPTARGAHTYKTPHNPCTWHRERNSNYNKYHWPARDTRYKLPKLVDY